VWFSVLNASCAFHLAHNIAQKGQDQLHAVCELLDIYWPLLAAKRVILPFAISQKLPSMPQKGLLSRPRTPLPAVRGGLRKI
jgi:hypothetical protein